MIPKDQPLHGPKRLPSGDFRIATEELRLQKNETRNKGVPMGLNVNVSQETLGFEKGKLRKKIGLKMSGWVFEIKILAHVSFRTEIMIEIQSSQVFLEVNRCHPLSHGVLLPQGTRWRRARDGRSPGAPARETQAAWAATHPSRWNAKVVGWKWWELKKPYFTFEKMKHLISLLLKNYFLELYIWYLT